MFVRTSFANLVIFVTENNEIFPRNCGRNVGWQQTEPCEYILLIVWKLLTVSRTRHVIVGGKNKNS